MNKIFLGENRSGMSYCSIKLAEIVNKEFAKSKKDGVQ
jgi:hypothetical protein